MKSGPQQAERSHPTESLHGVVLQKSIHAQIRQLILYIGNDKVEVEEFVREITFAKRLHKNFL